MDWRDIELDVVKILVGGLSVVGFAGFAVALIFGILFVVGETVEHFTPEDCPPFYQCTPKGDWNAKNCKCWDSK